ncbi:hypothetical protein VSH64_34650 [Amycolatopsis rhabdoformis]|uniref:NUDIX hydrolase n=1 Tax=Amycolatopsis rhabdoformis TaxID=1448059 RepID=A0ABZ1I0L8_9PSEU|nr:hypothetical protein [Amycolatopsis rhabdoformis]WSE27957.1 hypothetical protein VSH64_34650 [Amycolatopsis rhabdoformis]
MVIGSVALLNPGHGTVAITPRATAKTGGDRLVDDLAELAEVLQPYEPGTAMFIQAHRERLVRVRRKVERRRTLRSLLGLFRGGAGSFDDLSLHDHGELLTENPRMEQLRAAVAREAREELGRR